MTSLTEKVALMERLNITNDGLVEIREPENEDKEGSGKIKGLFLKLMMLRGLYASRCSLV
ncbi:unnamed protein product [Meloidogyne enterolobii]|uniref:Uncharacterized protein n=1 Tax=Meloidogyne enterolobii TaxID=390850 RepID=A0ACB0XMP7_MELEN